MKNIKLTVFNTQNMNIKYNLCTKNNFNELANLFNKCFNIFPKNNYFTWKFLQNPSGESITIIAIYSSKIIGSFTLIPELFLINDKKRKIYQGVDLYVDPEFRGKGIFKNLVKYSELELSRKEKKYYIFVHGVPVSGKGFAQNPRWSLVKEIKYYFSHRYYFLFNSFFKQKSNSDNIETNIPTKSELNIFFNNLIKSTKPIKKIFDAEIFIWRFVNHPYRKYKFVKLSTNNKIEALAVYSKNYRERIKIEYLDFINKQKISSYIYKICKFIFKYEKTNWIYSYKDSNYLIDSAFKNNGFIFNPFSYGLFSHRSLFIVCGENYIDKINYYDVENFEIMPCMGDD